MLKEHQNLIYGLDWISARGVYIYNLQIYNLQLVTIRFLPKPSCNVGKSWIEPDSSEGEKSEGGPTPLRRPPNPAGTGDSCRSNQTARLGPHVTCWGPGRTQMPPRVIGYLAPQGPEN